MKTKEERSESDQTYSLAAGRGKETLFRVSARNQIELIAIADNKANMITGIDAVLFSLSIAFFGSGLSMQGVPFNERAEVMVPFVILIFACLISAIFAILSAKPTIIKSPKSSLSLLFFQSFYDKSLEVYKEEMHTLLSSRETIYDQLIIDMYYNGLVLKRKYSLLNFSYMIFMIGIISSVVAFLFLWLL